MEKNIAKKPKKQNKKTKETNIHELIFRIRSFLLIVLINPSGPDPRRRKTIILNSYFYTSLGCLKRFYEGLIKPFEAPQSVKTKI